MQNINKNKVDPLVSWIVPVASGEKWLERCLNSVINQNYSNWEAIIVINGKVRLNEYNSIKKKYSTNRYKIYFFELEKKGMANALNFALKKSKGEWIARLDADDYCISTRLEKQLKYKEYDLICSNISLIDENENEIYYTELMKRYYNNKLSFFENIHNKFIELLSKYPKKFDICDELKFRNPIPHSSVLLRKNILTEIGGYISNKNGDNPCQDIRTWILLMSKGCKFYQVNEILTKISIHPRQITGSIKPRLEVIKIYFSLFIKYKDIRSLMSCVFHLSMYLSMYFNIIFFKNKFNGNKY